MKKTTWLLLALSLVAMLLVAGCAPTTPKPSPSPSPTVAPTPTPGVAPKVVKTMVTKGQGDGEFKITIVFDKDVYSSCAENWRNWTVRVVNSQRKGGNIEVGWFAPVIVGNQIILYGWVEEVGAPVITYALRPLPDGWTGFDFAASVGNLPAAITAAGKIIADAQKVVDAVNALSAADLAAFLSVHHTEYDALLLALNAAKAAKAVLENPAATQAQINAALADLDDLDDAYQALGLQAVEIGRTTPTFAGLICSEDDAAAYKKAFGIEVTAADVVTWELSNNCAISDILGNSQCGYSGQACCVGPECEECEECDLTTGVCK